MDYLYDDQNIFAKIICGDIPNDTVAESDHSLAFRDISPQAPVHVLVVPKGHYVNFDHFANAATDAEIVDFNRMIGEVCKIVDISPGTGGIGYRVISNAGEAGVQEVDHLHVHILSGRPLGRMIGRS